MRAIHGAMSRTTQLPRRDFGLLFTVLLIAASSMAVVVAGLLIAAFAFNVF